MSDVQLQRSGSSLTVTAPSYRLGVEEDAPWARLEDDLGPWADLCLLASAHTRQGPDDTDRVSGPTIAAWQRSMLLSWRLESSHWNGKRLMAECSPGEVALTLEVDGRGALTDVTLLGGPGTTSTGSGPHWSRSWFDAILPGAPTDPGRVVLPADRSSSVSASGGGEPGRAGWFFSPGPLWFGASRVAPDDGLRPPAGDWLGFGLAAAPDAQRFLGFHYHASDHGFRFGLDYEGQTRVRGDWTSPTLLIRPARDAYEAIADYRQALSSRDLIPASEPAAPRPAWWSEPMFCGWGAQVALALAEGLTLADAPERCTQGNYDEFLDRLEANGVIPGTIVIDDGWQASYGAADPHPDRWVDLAGWIGRRHDRDQRVLLWWRAWDSDGLPPEWSVRTAGGERVALDINHPAARRSLAATVERLLGRSGLDADGLKIDFTARTPSGASLVHRAGPWGLAYLRRLLATIRDAAKATKRDALLIGQVPEPSLAPLFDMIRLNDMLRLEDPPPSSAVVPQMEYRARVVRAACPDHLIDTDDWSVPDLATWREYARLKPRLGVPSLYYADRLDLSGEALTDTDYALLRRTWADYRQRIGLPAR